MKNLNGIRDSLGVSSLWRLLRREVEIENKNWNPDSIETPFACWLYKPRDVIYESPPPKPLNIPEKQ